uniref:BED-type domain-containing protein n=1 Tax=Cacopsylla melanoneura TaxID=428564 RepID=A0A8D8YA29_9HEMI
MSSENTDFIIHKKNTDQCSVWFHFLTSSDGKSAKCKICSSTLKTLGGSTKGLHTHLQTKHKVKVSKEYAPEPSGSSSTSASSSTSTPATTASCSTKRVGSPLPTSTAKRTMKDYFKVVNQQEPLAKVLSRMTARDGLPFSTFTTSEDLRDLLIFKGYKELPTSPVTIRNHVVVYSKEIKESEILQAKERGDRFSLSFDEWTSNSNKRFMNMNVHSPDNFWNLGLIRVKVSMTAEVCVALLEEKLSYFGLSLKDDIVGIVTDGPNVMLKVGKLLPVKHQLCFAHGIHLAVCDVLYKKKSQDDTEMIELQDIVGIGEDVDDVLESLDSLESGLTVNPNEDVNEAPDLTSDKNISEVIKKVRKVVVHFKRSSTKNDTILQKYVRAEKGKELSLILDVKTRWNSLLDMIERFVLLKSCIQKALIDAKYQIKLEDCDFDVLKEIIGILAPIKLTVEALCRRDANLCTADAALKFLLHQLSQNKTNLSEKMMSCLIIRLKQRRSSTLSGVLNYLQNPGLIESCEDFEGLFSTPSSSGIKNEMKLLIQRLVVETKYNSPERTGEMEVANVDDPEIVIVSEGRSLESNTPSLQIMLERAILDSQKPREPEVRQSDLLSTLRKECSLYESCGTRGYYLTKVYNFLRSVPPTSVEAERAFSAAGYIQNKLRSRLGDETLDCLLFLRSHFQKLEVRKE